MAAARRRQRRQRLIISLVLAALVVGLIAVVSIAGGNDDKDDTSSATSTTTSKAPTTMPKPTIEVPKEAAPTELVKKDLKVGSGPTAKEGDSVDVNYVGVTYSDGKQFDASWDRGQTFNFTIGAGKVIKGWDQGVAGMKVGGRRELIIPGSLAYGDPAPAGYPNGTLIFIVDLVAIK